MKKWGTLLAGWLLLFPYVIWAQSYAESALLFSRTSVGGSARIQGMGGTQVSLGGDISSSYLNPAGLGMFNHSDFSISLGNSSQSSTSSYLGNNSKDSYSKVIMPNIGISFHHLGGDGAFKGGSFSISYNRTNNFNQSFNYNGINKSSSIIDYFVDDANNAQGYPTQLFNTNGYLYNTPTELAWDTYLLNTASATDSLHYATDVGGIPNQYERVQTSGSQGQINIAYGANFLDKIFVGGGIGITTLSYKSIKTYQETFSDDPYLSSLQLNEALSTTGTGFNLTLGSIYRPVDIIQLGVSIATPTIYSLTDNYSATLSTNWRNFPYSGSAPSGFTTDQVISNYTLRTPWRLNAGATVFIQKYGLISADIEYIDYTANHYNSTEFSMSSDNDEIKHLYKSALNYRFGAEFRYSHFRLRAGYNFMPDPYINTHNNTSTQIQSETFGVGYKATNFYVDVTAVLGSNNNTYTPYTLNNPPSPLVNLSNKNTMVMVTVGFPFGN